MSTPAAASLISAEKYLRNPAYRRSEYVGGRIVQRAMGTKEHGYLQGRRFRKFDECFDTHEGEFVSIEAHCRFVVNGELRFQLPNVCVILDHEDATGFPCF